MNILRNKPTTSVVQPTDTAVDFASGVTWSDDVTWSGSWKWSGAKEKVLSADKPVTGISTTNKPRLTIR